MPYLAACRQARSLGAHLVYPHCPSSVARARIGLCSTGAVTSAWSALERYLVPNEMLREYEVAAVSTVGHAAHVFGATPSSKSGKEGPVTEPFDASSWMRRAAVKSVSSGPQPSVDHAIELASPSEATTPAAVSLRPSLQRQGLQPAASGHRETRPMTKSAGRSFQGNYLALPLTRTCYPEGTGGAGTVRMTGISRGVDAIDCFMHLSPDADRYTALAPPWSFVLRTAKSYLTLSFQHRVPHQAHLSSSVVHGRLRHQRLPTSNKLGKLYRVPSFSL